jgi:hypothetical protein
MIIAGSTQSADGSRVAWPPGDAVKSSAFHQLKIKHDIRGIGAGPKENGRPASIRREPVLNRQLHDDLARDRRSTRRPHGEGRRDA